MAQKIQLVYKKRDIWPRTSIDNVVDPKTGKPIDLSKLVPASTAPTYTINGTRADANGNFTITAKSIGAASIHHTHTAAEVNAASVDHTHTPGSIGAAAASHTHSISEIEGLEARLINGGGSGGSGLDFDITPLNDQTFPEPSSWNN